MHRSEHPITCLLNRQKVKKPMSARISFPWVSFFTSCSPEKSLARGTRLSRQFSSVRVKEQFHLQILSGLCRQTQIASSCTASKLIHKSDIQACRICYQI